MVLGVHTDRQMDCSNKCRTSLGCQPYLANMFFQKIQSAYYVCCIYSNAFESNFISEANTMDHDQTAPKKSGFMLFETLRDYTRGDQKVRGK